MSGLQAVPILAGHDALAFANKANYRYEYGYLVKHLLTGR
jgi:hypothetical protein